MQITAMHPPPTSAAERLITTGDRTAQIRQVAEAFEAVFLAEMLRAAGAGEGAKAFGGGIGEEQFSSFLLDEQARLMAERGGVGIAEMVIRGMQAQGRLDR